MTSPASPTPPLPPTPAGSPANGTAPVAHRAPTDSTAPDAHSVPVTDDTPTVDIVASMVGNGGDDGELDLGAAAAVSNVGLVHQTNEDGYALRTVQLPPARSDATVPAGADIPDRGSARVDGSAYASGNGSLAGHAESITLAAVCDGVSTAPGSGPAAVRAARDAVDLLAHIATTMSAAVLPADEAIAGGAGPGTPVDGVPATGGVAAHLAGDVTVGGADAGGADAGDVGDDDAPTVGGDFVAGDTRPLGPRRHPSDGPGTAWQPSALRAAAAAAERGALASVVDSHDSPACTFVAAIVTSEQITIGWLGDSRAYLLDQSGPQLLTRDDTVAAEAVRAGLRPAGTAESGPGSHTITRWLGTSSPGTVPHVITCTPSGSGRLILCSDGLWNYLSAPERLAARVQELPADASPLAVARHLTSAALVAGGGDNITVIVVDLP
ncbi:PP2C family serine/threonine-protein phosphatase [Frankia sp. R82]|uniref:PP2C family protein-serine/threonine phosphatase n=1 Tax=Frankia sp. R82 TaxID=2950553 RepID=UPI002043F934|nr:PP2C family protein-serine/threonine phosphatase [Frankia sp. R82]MCM3885834.1 protein phosphatase 2C domain-containing protein [Frankia sp. R82]